MRTSSISLYDQEPFRKAVGHEFRPGGTELTEEAARECRLISGERVLDIACGVGSTAEYLSSHWGVQVVGLDRSTQFLEEASARCQAADFLQGEAARLPFADGIFDAVFCECFLTMADDPGAVLREARRVLRPGGRLAITDIYLRRPEAASNLEHLPRQTCLAGARGREDVLEGREGRGLPREVCGETARIHSRGSRPG